MRPIATILTSLLGLVTIAATNAQTVQNIPTTADNWTVMYSGYGTVEFENEKGVVFQPMVSRNPGETHASLLLAENTEKHPPRDFELTFTVTTEEQLRTVAPAPWEVFWLFFNYVPMGSTQKRTNYFLVKPNGIELGKAHDVVRQEFLYTGPNPKLVIGTPARWRVIRRGRSVVVEIDGTTALSYHGSLIDEEGAIGLYTEDARVRVREVQLIRF